MNLFKSAAMATLLATAAFTAAPAFAAGQETDLPTQTQIDGTQFLEIAAEIRTFATLQEIRELDHEAASLLYQKKLLFEISMRMKFLDEIQEENQDFATTIDGLPGVIFTFDVAFTSLEAEIRDRRKQIDTLAAELPEGIDPQTPLLDQHTAELLAWMHEQLDENPVE